MKYMALLYGEASAGPAPGTPEFMQMLDEYRSATSAMADGGVLIRQQPAAATTDRHNRSRPQR